jgi:hypothetical protein
MAGKLVAARRKVLSRVPAAKVAVLRVVELTQERSRWSLGQAWRRWA